MENNTKKNNLEVSSLPIADIDEYFIHIYPDVPENCTEGFVGFVGNATNKDLRIEIEIDHKFMIEHNYVTMALCCDRDDPLKATIVMTPRYFDMLRKTPYLLFELWHEVGHYHTNRYFNTQYNEKGSANAIRLEYYKHGEVMPEERAADLFGLYYTSKKDAIQALCEAIKRRNTYSWEPKETKEIAIEEFKRRKKILNNLDSDEKIRKALCQVCNVSNFYDI